jgi:REP element-mobilizing transposase RayT
MTYNPDNHHRRSIRLDGYDYSQPGIYFITLCTYNRECLFGEILNGEMRLNEFGKMTQQCWLEIPNHFPQTQLDEYIIMPDHIHGIIILNDFVGVQNVGAKNVGTKNVGAKNVGAKNVGAKNVGAKNFSPLPIPTPMPIPTPEQYITPFRSPSKTIGSIIRGFKIGVTKWFRQNTDIYVVWQRNFYEHIIRNEVELNRIRQYIIDNPKKWKTDEN